MSSSLGKSLQNSKKRRQRATGVAHRGRVNDNLAEAQREAEAEEARRQRQQGHGLRSIWETNELENFLEIADAREDGYNAERNVKLVIGGTVHVVSKNNRFVPEANQEHTPGDAGAAQAGGRHSAKDWLRLSELLTVPRRPAWDYATTTAAALAAAERKSFTDWRRGLARLEEEHEVTLTPYEKNLEVWRQLWRVVERADVVGVIVDARNPLVFRCKDFEDYVASHKVPAVASASAASTTSAAAAATATAAAAAAAPSASPNNNNNNNNNNNGNNDSASPLVSKKLVIILNKADLLTEQQRKAWAAYFTARGDTFFFFSAKTADDATVAAQLAKDKEREERRKSKKERKSRHADPNERGGGGDGSGEEEASGSEEEDEDDEEEESEEEESEEEEEEMSEHMLKALTRERKDKTKSRHRKKALRAPVRVDANPYELAAQRKAWLQNAKSLNHHSAANNRGRPLTSEERARDRRLASGELQRLPPWHVMDPVQLLDCFAMLRESVVAAGGRRAAAPGADTANTANAASNNKRNNNKNNNNVRNNRGSNQGGDNAQGSDAAAAVPAGAFDDALMIGLVGYPNVGKSSTINAIMGAKRVVVSSTPGKTKHFQTLAIPTERRVALCDCPGLVFPTFASTQQQMVCDGILPINTCTTDVIARAVAVVCRRVPRAVLEHKFVVCLDPEAPTPDESRTLAERLLNAVARRRGYMSSHDTPNKARAARDVLNAFVDGALVYAEPPPTFAPSVEARSIERYVRQRQREAAAAAEARHSSGAHKGTKRRPPAPRPGPDGDNNNGKEEAEIMAAAGTNNTAKPKKVGFALPAAGEEAGDNDSEFEDVDDSDDNNNNNNNSEDDDNDDDEYEDLDSEEERAWGELEEVERRDDRGRDNFVEEETLFPQLRARLPMRASGKKSGRSKKSTAAGYALHHSAGVARGSDADADEEEDQEEEEDEENLITPPVFFGRPTNMRDCFTRFEYFNVGNNDATLRQMRAAAALQRRLRRRRNKRTNHQLEPDVFTFVNRRGDVELLIDDDDGVLELVTAEQAAREAFNYAANSYGGTVLRSSHLAAARRAGNTNSSNNNNNNNALMDEMDDLEWADDDDGIVVGGAAGGFHSAAAAAGGTGNNNNNNNNNNNKNGPRMSKRKQRREMKKAGAGGPVNPSAKRIGISDY